MGGRKTRGRERSRKEAEFKKKDKKGREVERVYDGDVAESIGRVLEDGRGRSHDGRGGDGRDGRDGWT